MSVHVFSGFTIALFFSLWVNGVAANESVEDTLEIARKQVDAAIENKKQIEPTIKLFERIARVEPKYAGRAQVYIGVLVALKGKYTFLPHAKLKWAKRGLAIMDSGLKKNPDDIEALFIHGATCYHLPFFFKRRDDAHRDFIVKPTIIYISRSARLQTSPTSECPGIFGLHYKEIIKQMPLQMHTYPPKLIRNIVAFLLENAKLMPDEKTYLQALKDRLETERPVGHN